MGVVYLRAWQLFMRSEKMIAICIDALVSVKVFVCDLDGRGATLKSNNAGRRDKMSTSLNEDIARVCVLSVYISPPYSSAMSHFLVCVF